MFCMLNGIGSHVKIRVYDFNDSLFNAEFVSIWKENDIFLKFPNVAPILGNIFFILKNNREKKVFICEFRENLCAKTNSTSNFSLTHTQHTYGIYHFRFEIYCCCYYYLLWLWHCEYVCVCMLCIFAFFFLVVLSPPTKTCLWFVNFWFTTLY